MADTQQQQPPGKCAACLQRIRNCCGWMRDFCGRWSVGMAPPSQGVRVTKLWQALLAELLGTMLFVLLGTGAWIETEPDRDRDPVRIAFTFGFSYAVLVYALRYISGGHLNPVISLCAAVIRRISPLRALLDVLVQCVGAILGSALLYAFTPNGQHDHLGATVPGENVSQDKSFAVEFFGTFVFVFVTVACWDKAKGEDTPTYINPFVIGITLIVAELYAIPYTGGGLNPARSFGPAIVKNEWRDHWVYWFGPILGGLAGALIYDFVFSSGASLARVRKCMLANEPPRSKIVRGTEAGSTTEQQSLRAHHTPSPDIHEEEIELKVEGDASEKSQAAAT